MRSVLRLADCWPTLPPAPCGLKLTCNAARWSKPRKIKQMQKLPMMLGAALLLVVAGCATQPQTPDVGAVVEAPRPKAPPVPQIVRETPPKPPGYFQRALADYFGL